MEKINQQISVFADILTGKFQTQTKRVIALATAFSAIILAIFGRFLSLSSVIRESLSYVSSMFPSDAAEIIGNGHFSLINLMRFAFEIESTSDGIVIGCLIGGFVIFGAIALIGILSGKKNSTLGLAVVSVVSMLISLITAAGFNSELNSYMSWFGTNVKFCEANSQIFVVLLLAVASHIFYVACHSDMTTSGELENLGTAKEEFLIMFNKAKSEATKATDYAVAKAQQAKEDNSCKTCGKLVSPNAKFCSSCGAAKEAQAEVVKTVTKEETTVDTSAE